MGSGSQTVQRELHPFDIQQKFRETLLRPPTGRRALNVWMWLFPSLNPPPPSPSATTKHSRPSLLATPPPPRIHLSPDPAATPPRPSPSAVPFPFLRRPHSPPRKALGSPGANCEPEQCFRSRRFRESRASRPGGRGDGVGGGAPLRVRRSSKVVGNSFRAALGAGVDLLTKNRFGRRPSPVPEAEEAT